MAQPVRHDEVELESLLQQAKEKALLQKDDPDQKTGEAYLHAWQLTYANREDWKFSYLEISQEGIAELIDGKVVQVDGEYSTEKLEVGSYGVYFDVMLKDDFNIASPVKLTLALPDGSVQTDYKDLKSYSKNVRIWLKAGNFFNKVMYGDIKFALSGTECETLKKGLVMCGVHISTKTDAKLNERAVIFR